MLRFGEGTAKMFWHSTTIPAQPKCATCLCSHSHPRASLCLGAGGLSSVSWCCCANARLAQLAARHAVQPRGLFFGYCSTKSDLEALLARPVRGSRLSSRGTLMSSTSLSAPAQLAVTGCSYQQPSGCSCTLHPGEQHA